MSDARNTSPNASSSALCGQNSNTNNASSREVARPTVSVSVARPRAEFSDHDFSAPHDRITSYDPTGHYASAYSRIADSGQTQVAANYNNFSRLGAGGGDRDQTRHRRLHQPTSHDYDGLESNDSFPTPVDVNVRGHFVRPSPPGYGDMADNNNSSTSPSLFYDENSSLDISGSAEKHNVGHGKHFAFSDAYGDNDDFASDFDSDQGLFVDENPPRHSKHPRRLDKKVGSGLRRDAPRRFSHDDYSRLPASRHPAQPPEKAADDRYFNNFGRNLDPSRYSGVPMPWGVHRDPKMQMQEEVSDASLLKRNIKRGRGEKVSKRGYGANDPENIAIVNMKDIEGLSFHEIAEKLNNERVIAGKNPTLSTCGVNARYNRTAPLLFAAHGQEFVPLSQRRVGDKFAGAPGAEKPVWNEELDLELVKCVKEVEGQKWETVAAMFQEITGKSMNAKAAALRHSML